MTFIHEFRHPRVVVHYNPVDGDVHSADEFTNALSHEPHAIEVDPQAVHGQVVAGEEGSATLSEVIDRILAHKEHYSKPSYCGSVGHGLDILRNLRHAAADN